MMKNLAKKLNYALIVIITLTSVSCEKGLIGIKGEGAVIEQELIVSDFEGFDLDISGNVHITQSDTQQVTIKAQQNIINNLKTEIKNGILILEFDKNVRSYDGLDIYINSPLITKAQINGSGDINSRNKFNQTENLEIGISGSGNIDIQFTTKEIYSQLTGSGNITIDTDCNYLSTRITGSGNYFLTGTALEVEHGIDGSGNIYAYGLATESTEIYNSGSSKVEVSVNKTLHANISGSGDIYYKGTPTVSVKISGSGQLIQAN